MKFNSEIFNNLKYFRIIINHVQYLSPKRMIYFIQNNKIPKDYEELYFI